LGLTVTIYFGKKEYEKLTKEIMPHFKAENESQAINQLIREWKKPLISFKNIKSIFSSL